MNQLLNNSLVTMQTLAHFEMHTSTSTGGTTTTTTIAAAASDTTITTTIIPCECHIKFMLNIITVRNLSVICHIIVRP